MNRRYGILVIILSCLWCSRAAGAADPLSLAEFLNQCTATDHTPCLRTWIDTARRTGRKDLYVPPGTYVYNTDARTIPLFSGMHLQCAGPGASIFKNIGRVGNLFFSDSALENVVVENCGFDVNGGTADFLFVIAVNSGAAGTVSHNIHIRGNRFRDTAILGRRSAQHRQYIVLLPCNDCWVQDN